MKEKCFEWFKPILSK